MTLSYPIDVNPASNDYVIFRPHQYRSNNAYPGQGANNAGGAEGPPVGSDIILYMPNSTPIMGNTQSWNQQDFVGPLGMLKAGLATGVAAGITEIDGLNKASGDQLVEKLKGQFENLKNKGGAAAKQMMIGAVAESMGTTASNAMALAKGQVYNPNIELCYQAPERRNFGFAFNFIPKNPAETQRVNDIILEFKKWSSPKENGAMFDVPCVWQVIYMTNGAKNTRMNAFKRAALSNISIQANPSSDMHATFADGMPISTSMSLQFQEIDIITRDDHLSSGTLQGF